MLLFLLMMMLDQGDGVAFRETEIFAPLRVDDVVVADNGHLYLLDFNEAIVLHYDADGERLDDIGRKGQGPGEFQNPTRLYLDSEGRLVVVDAGARNISWFSLDGVFSHRMEIPRKAQDYVKTSTGWAYGDWMHSHNPGDPIQLYLADDAFEGEQAIAQWPRDADKSSEIRIESDGSVMKMPMNPARSGMELAVSNDGRMIYVSHPGTAVKIDVFDVAQKKKIQTIKSDVPPIPFNSEWGDLQLKKMSENRSGGMKFQFVPDYPEHFPLVRDLFGTVQSGVIARLWTGRPDKDERALSFTPQGEKLDAGYETGYRNRILARTADYAYISMFDADEEEAWIRRCKPSEINAVIEANPILFEGSGARLIMRMN